MPQPLPPSPPRPAGVRQLGAAVPWPELPGLRTPSPPGPPGYRVQSSAPHGSHRGTLLQDAGAPQSLEVSPRPPHPLMLRAGSAEIKTYPSGPSRSFTWEGSRLPAHGSTTRPLSKWSPMLKAERNLASPRQTCGSSTHGPWPGRQDARDEMALSYLQFREMLEATAQEGVFQRLTSVPVPSSKDRDRTTFSARGSVSPWLPAPHPSPSACR